MWKVPCTLRGTAEQFQRVYFVYLNSSGISLETIGTCFSVSSLGRGEADKKDISFYMMEELH